MLELVVPVPADGLCLSHCVVASRNIEDWMENRNIRGDRDDEREYSDEEEAQAVLASIISRMEAARK